jgi:UDP-N-acetylglucosamine 4,6-dehydratase
MFKDSTILISGGTGSFGQNFTEIILQYDIKKLIIFSRDELKQYNMRNKFNDSRLRFFIGDVRDKDRLYRAFEGVDYIIHAAAQKQVPSCEYNPFEAIKTNVLGAQNIIEASIDKGVKKVIALSTDKAVNPQNLYGATKLCSDKLFISGNSYASGKNTKFSVVRYGNVIGSRGSVIPLFFEQQKTGVFTITDPRMTRFWITLDEAVMFVLKNFQRMQGGEVYIPKIPSMKIIDLAKAINNKCEHKIIGIKPGEKIHESMISVNDAKNTLEYYDYFIIQPDFKWWNSEKYINQEKGSKVHSEFSYTSDNNKQLLTIKELKEMLKELI